ncbi:MAG: hypothetical protein F7B95_00265 [Desulfurococcales archaeon]|nr:hypothetical protein [Desulfurococcales archaeon]
MHKIRVRLLASLKEAVGGSEYIEVEAGDWREALRILRGRYPALANALDENGEPKPGFMVFVDGVDYRLAPRNSKPKEIALLPITHGGDDKIELEWVTWEDLESIVENLARSIERSGYKVDVVIGILRGGVIPAKLLADELGVDDLGVIEVKLYTAVAERRHRPYIRQPLTLPVKDRNVLLVDDVSDTGLTLEFTVNAIQLYSPKSIKTATLYIKPWTKMVPDYYGRVTNKWLVFPWEKREIERELERLKEKT